MTKYYLLLLLNCLLCLPAMAQIFKGRVADVKGSPIPYASIYVRELSAGFTSDDDGRFHTTMKSGNYTCEVSCIGFASQKFQIRIPAAGLEKDVVLSERVYELGEVSVRRGGEDPAYSIMRQVIANAPYHRQQVKSYTAGTYMKGTGKLIEIPAILKLSKEVRTESKKYMGKLFVFEEQREVRFTAPNTYDNRVKAYQNSFPENIKIEMGLATVDFYAPTIYGKISPLSVGAFTYYRYKLEGCYSEGEYLVNKIKLIPKKDNPKLLSGYIYIIENLWCLSSAELSFSGGGMSAVIKSTCKEVQPSVFLPTSTSVEFKFNVMGLRAQGSFLGAIHYAQLEVNKKVPGNYVAEEAKPTSRPLSAKEQKVLNKIEELSSKSDLTMGDAYQLSKLISKSMQAKDTVPQKHKFERKTISRQSTVKIDSLAEKKDSSFWALVRTVPLKPEEFESFQRVEKLPVDTLKKKKAQTGGEASIKAGDNKGVFESILFGHAFRSKDKNTWLHLKGLDSSFPQYNFVDGLWMGASFTVGRKFSPASVLTFTPQAYYTTARKTVVGFGDITLEYAPRLLGKLTLSGGSLSSDYNTESGESLLINSLSTILFARNDVKFYDKQYFSVRNEVEIANSLLLTSGINWERRKTLENSISKSLFGKTGTSNTPNNASFVPMPANELLKASFALEYTPMHYYRMIRGKKQYDDSKWPTFALNYERAFPLETEVVSPSYHRVELSVRHKFDFGMMNTLQWTLNGGQFMDAKNMQFPDYKHFEATRFPVTFRTFSDGFHLLDNYAYSTPNRWVQGGITWSTPYLLLKHLPFLKRKSFDEALHIRTLGVSGRRAYTEMGYSIGFAHWARAGVFTSFNGTDYQSVGVSVSVSLPR